MEQLEDLFARLPAYLGGHLVLSLTALAVGLAISLPLGIYLSRRPKRAELVLAIAGIIQTVPTLALLAVMVMVLNGLIGFWPAFLALTLYSLLPILANTIIGIRGVDPVLTEAAQALGMTRAQTLRRVELPLAAPTILGGIRTATVLVVGTATLATPVGGLSLGNYIFTGLESMNHAWTVFGCVAAALLAILLDQLIRLLGVAARRRSKRRAVVAASGLLLIVGCGLAEPVTDWLTPGQRAIVASGPFTEQNLLSHVMGHHLKGAGFRPDHRQGMSEGIQLEALRHNQVDCLVNYSGNVWTLLMKQDEFKDRQTTLDLVAAFLAQYGVVYLGPLGFENAYAVCIRKDTADRFQLKSIPDLVTFTDKLRTGGKRLRLGADNQFFGRPEWKGLKQVYQLNAGYVDERAMDPGLMYDGLKDGALDAIVAYTSDGRIDKFKLHLLRDPEQVFPPYDAILLVSRAAANRPGFVDGLRPLLGAIDQPTMRAANLLVDDQGMSPAKAGAELTKRIKERQQP